MRHIYGTLVYIERSRKSRLADQVSENIRWQRWFPFLYCKSSQSFQVSSCLVGTVSQQVRSLLFYLFCVIFCVFILDKCQFVFVLLFNWFTVNGRVRCSLVVNLIIAIVGHRINVVACRHLDVHYGAFTRLLLGVPFQNVKRWSDNAPLYMHSSCNSSLTPCIFRVNGCLTSFILPHTDLSHRHHATERAH